MKKILVPLIFLAMLAVPTAVFAHTQAVSTTQFYACEAASTSGSIAVGDIDPNSITQEDTLTCDPKGAYPLKVQWNVKGEKGDPGDPGKPGGPGPAGIPFTHAACTEVLSGSQQQENKVFCISGIEPDGGAIYNVAIAAAGSHIILGTPIYDTPSQDWGNVPLTNYVGFTSGFHMEVHSDGKVRVYNTLNQQVF